MSRPKGSKNKNASSPKQTKTVVKPVETKVDESELSNFNKRMKSDGVSLVPTSEVVEKAKPCKLNCFLCGKRIDGEYFLYNYVIGDGGPPKNQYISKQCKPYVAELVSGGKVCNYATKIKD